MSAKRVLIVSSHGLFREGLKHILSGDVDLALAEHVATIQEAEERARSGQVDVVIVERTRQQQEGQERRAAAIAHLLEIADLRVIAVSLDSGDLWIYRRERVTEATVEDLVAALMD